MTARAFSPSFWPVALGAALGACSSNEPPERSPRPEQALSKGPLAPELVAACPGAADLFSRGGPLCTMMGCVSGLGLFVYPAGGWPAGAYRFAFELDGRSITCTGNLPFPSCDEADLKCDGEGVHLTISGCALPPSEHGFGGLWGFDGFPRVLSIDAQRDGVSVAHARFEPRYQASQPNGPGCEPVCCGASGNFTLALPAQR